MCYLQFFDIFKKNRITAIILTNARALNFIFDPQRRGVKKREALI